MLTRRDVATLIWYALLFSSIVLWASQRASEEAPYSAHAIPRAAFAPDPADHAGDLLETHRISQVPR